MTIPSPRKLIEITAFFFFALCVMAGIVIAIVLLSIMKLAEKVYDALQGLKMRRRA